MTLINEFDIIKKLYGATKTPHADENRCRGVLLSWKNETAENQPLHFTKNLVKTFGGKMEKSFILCGRRIATMRERLGKACDLIDNEQWLGVFRNRQINYEKEFDQSVKMVKLMKKAGKIKNASHYFAKIWKKENINKTLKIVREFLNRQISKLAEKREQKKQNECDEIISKSFNNSGYLKFQAMKHNFNLS